VATIFLTLIVTAIVLTFAFANIQLLPSTLNKTEGNMATTTTEIMAGDSDSDSDSDSEYNATEINGSRKISAFYNECPFSFC
jgi:hypothetical protein